tara:strand:+ start:8101 stop:8529 length:429 start_codon:yes stop_codon:yes gene_type:complete
MSTLDIDNMVLSSIDVEAITNTLGTGVFDKLMLSVNNNILEQFNEGRINSTDYATVYLGSLQSVLAQSIQFVLQEQVSEAQIGSTLKDIELKKEQLKGMYTDRVLKDKQAAKLGLDNVMKVAENSRNLNENFVYEPQYVEVI